MHRYLVKCEDKNPILPSKFINYYLVTADNMNNAYELMDKTKRLFIVNDLVYLKLYNPKIDGDKKISAYISKNWVKLKNE